jgi:hypothetical protein
MFVDIAVWVAVQQGTDYGMWLQNGLGDVDFDSGVVRGVQSNVYSHALPSMQEEVTKQWDSEFGKLPVKKWLFLPPCFNGLVRAQLRNVGRTIRP